MKVLKVFVALIISFLLLCTQALLMGAFACDKSFASGSVTKAIQETDFTQQLYEEALKASNKEADKTVQQFLKGALQTDTAARFMGDYASSAINSVLYGKEYTRFTQDDLNQLASESLDELSKKSGIQISDSQRQQVLSYVKDNGDSIVKQINDTLPVVEQESITDNSEMAAISQVQTFLGTPLRVVLIIICVIIGIMLAALFWRSKLGFIWWATVSFILGSVFLLLGTSSDLLSSYIQDSGEGTVFSLLLTGMFSQGFTFVGIAALALTALLVVICLICRKVSGRHEAY